MTAVARPTLRPLPLAAALSGFAALAVALLLGPGATRVPAVVLGGLAVALLLAELVRRGRELMRSGLGPQILLALLGSAVVSAAWSVVVAAHAEYLGLAFILGLGGTALVMLGLLRIADERQAGQTPWQALTGGPTDAANAAKRFRRAAPLLLGALALLIGLRLLVEAFMSPMNGGMSDRAFVVAVLLLMIFVVGPGWALREVFTGRSAMRRTPPAAATRDEQVVAAHLHDSVLQTLSLIQRSADDPARVQQLARQQERSLRAWLAGRDDKAGKTLAAAVRLVAQEVEDEQPGAVIEVVAVGDAPLDPEADAMVRAAREALRNAVRHAGSPVRVFVEVADGVRELFVRDTGSGFDLDAVADERRGVRDAIIGRMEHVGGAATIDSSAAGTEIALRLPPPGEGGSR